VLDVIRTLLADRPTSLARRELERLDVDQVNPIGGCFLTSDVGLAILERLDDLSIFGKSPGLMFAVDQVAVGLDIEDAAAALDQFALDAELVLDCFRQTDGLWRVVSLNAVFDRNVHIVSFPQSWH
jgi:hypothetical protein